MKRVAFSLVLAFLALGVLAAAQEPSDPLSASLKALYDGVKRNVVESADKVPEADYAFKPTPEVRSFGELFGHIANSNYSSCARVKGEKNPNTGNDFEKAPTKAAIKKALADSFVYCDQAYAGMTDAKALAAVPAIAPAAPPAAGAKPAPPPPVAARVLVSVVSHTNEHYGNLVTYMRLRGMVPPSTERTQKPPVKH